MKVELNEHDGCFEIALVAETVSDASKLARMSINSKAELRWCGADAHRNGTFGGTIIVGKRTMATSTIM